MFGFLKKNGANKQLDAVIQRIQMNMENNYKDAAQLNLKEFEALLQELKDAGKLSEKQLSHYESKLSAFQDRMKNFTHKDQKPTWV